MFDFKNALWRRRFVIMAVSILIMGLGIHLFRFSLTGNDPSTALVIALADKTGMALGVMLILWNSSYFILEVIFGRKMIGAGTFVNWLCVGAFADLWGNILNHFIKQPTGLAARLFVMLIGVLILSLSCALYQTADLGISPYDSVSLILDRHLPIPYFWCRIMTDSACTVAAFLFGGIIGVGTLFCALGLGPFIAFFTKYIAEPLLKESHGEPA